VEETFHGITVRRFQYFETVGCMSGRTSGRYKKLWRVIDVFTCLEWGTNDCIWSNWCRCHPV